MSETRTYSTVEEIRQRFDQDVERFSNLETGQAAAMDSPHCMALIAQSAAATRPDTQALLDVGCGAGNYTLQFLQALAAQPASEAGEHSRAMRVTLLDLSRPMLNRAAQRVGEVVATPPVTLQGDVRSVDLGQSRFDVILASAVLHHLRTDQEWDAVFTRLHAALTPGGWLWIYDMVDDDHPALAALMRRQHGAYLESLGGAAYRDRVLAYIAHEDTPRSLADQLARMAAAGFVQPTVLHKRACFAAFGAMKPR